MICPVLANDFLVTESDRATGRFCMHMEWASFTPQRRIRLHNVLLAIAAASRSLAQAIGGGTRPPRPAVCVGDDVFLANEFGEGDDAIG